MEEVGAQIAYPMFIPQPLPPSMLKKRDFAPQNPGFSPNPSGLNWNPKLYDWDSLRFAVRPTSNGAEGSKDLNLRKGLEEDGEGLTLKLGVAEEDRAVVRPTKKVRAGSPGNGGGDGGGGGSYPMCQVDDCKVDLSNAKDYHRRHKVCEVHSKMTKAIVGNQMQRFCQQCSRFHPLSEFDEGKRSCRRRLAGHNRRRRKTQPEETPSKLLPPTNQGSIGNDNLDIVKLLTILSRLQGNDADKVVGIPSVPDKLNINQILSETHTLQAATSAPRSPVPGGFDLNISQVSEQPPSEQSRNPSTINFLSVLSQAGSDSGINKSKAVFPLIGSERKQCTLQSQLEISKDPIQKSQPSLPLQFFSSTEDDSPPKVGSFKKFLSSESSYPTDDVSPSSSPLFEEKHESMSVCRGDMTRRSHGQIVAVDFFKESEIRVENGSMLNHQCQASYTSSSGSDRSPSSSNSDGQDRTGRISFKLFDKDPSNIPGALRSQILNWLSNSPSEMESYIRPGCVVLSIYASMPSGAWDELEKNLLQRVLSLAQSSEPEFWGNGRFLTQTNGQLAIYNDGKVRLCKSWKRWGTPQITFVSPVAIVSGQETSFVLRGRNLTAPGTRIHCTFMGGYVSKEVSASAYPGTIYDSSTMENFNFHTGSLDTFGRCFIEVENEFKGNSFPIIIADATICQELRVLESDFEGDSSRDSFDENQVGPRSREDVLHFLNELGWLFQRKNITSSSHLRNYSAHRFNFLLTFSVERDWIAVVKRLLDLLVQKCFFEDDNLIQESLGMLLEIQLLSRAVKRKCRKMVDLLLSYSVKGSANESEMYLFPPDMAGPCGLTPLHIAASTQNSEDMVNALIDDPQEIGLKSWDSVFDENGQTPYVYASIRDNHSYNELVARKLSDKKNSQITILVENQENAGSRAIGAKSCSHCAAMDARRFRPVHRTQGFLYRPYMHSMLAIAAVCVCVCLLMRGMPKISNIAPFMWENLDYGPR